MDPVQSIVRKDEFCDCGSRKKFVRDQAGRLTVADIVISSRRKDCCHPFGKGDVLKFTSILIKISNHLALILPGNAFYR